MALNTSAVLRLVLCILSNIYAMRTSTSRVAFISMLCYVARAPVQLSDEEVAV